MLAQHRKLFEAKNDQVCDAVTLKTLLIIQVLMQKCVKQCSVICFCAWSGAGICEHSKFWTHFAHLWPFSYQFLSKGISWYQWKTKNFSKFWFSAFFCKITFPKMSWGSSKMYLGKCETRLDEFVSSETWKCDKYQQMKKSGIGQILFLSTADGYPNWKLSLCTLLVVIFYYKTCE